jgi:hypothetical protein
VIIYAAHIDVIRENPSYAVGWFTLALITAGLAQGKNRSGLLWFLLALFLGPVATFILVVFCHKLSDREALVPPGA